MFRLNVPDKCAKNFISCSTSDKSQINPINIPKLRIYPSPSSCRDQHAEERYTTCEQLFFLSQFYAVTSISEFSPYHEEAVQFHNFRDPIKCSKVNNSSPYVSFRRGRREEGLLEPDGLDTSAVAVVSIKIFSLKNHPSSGPKLFYYQKFPPNNSISPNCKCNSNLSTEQFHLPQLAYSQFPPNN